MSFFLMYLVLSGRRAEHGWIPRYDTGHQSPIKCQVLTTEDLD